MRTQTLQPQTIVREIETGATYRVLRTVGAAGEAFWEGQEPPTEMYDMWEASNLANGDIEHITAGDADRFEVVSG